MAKKKAGEQDELAERHLEAESLATEQAAAKAEQPGMRTPSSSVYPFTLERITLKRVDKLAGPRKYESKEVGIPFATFELGWNGSVRVEPKDDRLEELKEAVKALMHWTSDVGMDVAQEVAAEIFLEAQKTDEERYSASISEL